MKNTVLITLTILIGLTLFVPELVFKRFEEVYYDIMEDNDEY